MATTDHNALAASAHAPHPVHDMTLDPLRLIQLIRRRLPMGLIVFLLAGLIGVFALMATPRSYTASARIVIEPGLERLADGLETSAGAGLAAAPGLIETEIEALRARPRLERIVDDLGLARSPEFGRTRGLGTPRDRAVEAVGKRLILRRVGQSRLIHIGLEAQDAVMAARIVNALALDYLGERRLVHSGVSVQEGLWLEARLAALAAEVEAAEAAVEDYRIDAGLVTASGASMAESDLSALQGQLSEARSQQAQEEAQLATIQAAGADLPDVLASPGLRQLRVRRAEFGGRIADLSSRYGPLHPERQRVQDEADDLDAHIRAEVEASVAALQSRVAASRQRTTTVEAAIARVRGELSGDARSSVRLQALEREAETARALYAAFNQRARDAEAGPRPAVAARLSAPAVTPLKPSAPFVPLWLAFITIMAALAALAAMLLSELLNRRLESGDDIERRLGLPGLGGVPMLASVAGAGRFSDAPADYVLEHPLSGFSETVRALRAAIGRARSDGEVKVVAVTSALPGEGKSTMALCLARLAAQTQRNVVLVDGDLHQPDLSWRLGMTGGPGLIEVLDDPTCLDRALMRDEASGAWVLPLSDIVRGWKDPYQPEALQRLMALLRERFDLVVVDTAPAAASVDARTLAAHADAVAVLARWRRTPERAVQDTIRLLHRAGAPVAGVVLTQIDMRVQSRLGYGEAGYDYPRYRHERLSRG